MLHFAASCLMPAVYFTASFAFAWLLVLCGTEPGHRTPSGVESIAGRKFGRTTR